MLRKIAIALKISIVCSFIFISALKSQTKLHADEQYPTIMFIAEDSVGNKDTVKVIFHPESTDGLDAELGEVNLYEMPAEKDLDLRIIRRNDTLWWIPQNAPKDQQKPYWLYNPNIDDEIKDVPYLANGGATYVKPAPGNFDFKTEYLPEEYEFLLRNGVPLRLTNKHHSTVKFYLDFGEQQNPPFLSDWWVYSIFDEEYNCVLSETNGITPFYLFTDSIAVFKFGFMSGIKEEDIKFLYPNPASDVVALQDCNFGNEYFIINYNGLIIKKGIIDNDECVIKISDLPIATYYIRTKNNVYKLMKGEK